MTNYRLAIETGQKQTSEQAIQMLLDWHQRITAATLESQGLPLDADDLITDLFNAVYVLAKIAEANIE